MKQVEETAALNESEKFKQKYSKKKINWWQEKLGTQKNGTQTSEGQSNMSMDYWIILRL